MYNISEMSRWFHVHSLTKLIHNHCFYIYKLYIGSLNPNTGRPPTVLSSEQRQHVFNMESSRLGTDVTELNEKINYRLPKMNNDLTGTGETLQV